MADKKNSYFVFIAITLFYFIYLLFSRNMYFRGDDLLIIKASIINHFPITNTWLQSDQIYFRPLTIMLFYIQYLLNGLNPLNYYLFSVTIHIINSIIIFNILKKLRFLFGIKYDYGITFLFLLFLVNFISLGNIFWISEQHDLLTLLIILIIIYLQIEIKINFNKIFVLNFLVFVILGFLIKESFIVVNLYIFMFDFILNLRMKSKKNYLLVTISSVVTIIYLIYRYYFLHLGFWGLNQNFSSINIVYGIKYIIYGVSSLFFFADILDLLFLIYNSPTLFILRILIFVLLIVFGYFTFRKSNTLNKLYFLIFGFAGFICFSVYIGIFISPRLLYIVTPCIVFMLYFLCAKQNKRYLSTFLLLLFVNNLMSVQNEISKIYFSNEQTTNLLNTFSASCNNGLKYKYLDLTNIHRVSQMYCYVDKGLLLSAKYNNSLSNSEYKFIEPFMIESYPYKNPYSIISYTTDSLSVIVEMNDEISVITPPPSFKNYKYLNMRGPISLEDGIVVRLLKLSTVRQGYAARILIRFPNNYSFDNLKVLFYKDNKVELTSYHDFINIFNSN